MYFVVIIIGVYEYRSDIFLIGCVLMINTHTTFPGYIFIFIVTVWFDQVLKWHYLWENSHCGMSVLKILARHFVRLSLKFYQSTWKTLFCARFGCSQETPETAFPFVTNKSNLNIYLTSVWNNLFFLLVYLLRCWMTLISEYLNSQPG